MHLGVDLDNTLIRYDEVFVKYACTAQLVPSNFSGTKNELRRCIQQGCNGQERWERLQGLVYGEGIAEAALFPGVLRFLKRCSCRGITVDIVSHKTEFSHSSDNPLPLRKAATRFLQKAGLLTSGDRSLVRGVTFLSTRDEKIREINRSEFDIFIDDLPEVLDHPSLNVGLYKIGLLSENSTTFLSAETCGSWSEIEMKVLGSWNKQEIEHLGSEALGESLSNAYWVGGQGNSGIARASSSVKGLIALKIYSVDSEHDRLRSEFESFSTLRKYGEQQVPIELGCSKELMIGCYEWIHGSKVEKIERSHVVQMVRFLKNINKLRYKTEFIAFPKASAAVFSLSDLQVQVESRMKLAKQRVVTSQELIEFLEGELEPSIEEIGSWCRQEVIPSRYFNSIPRDDWILSPSDFGIHNAIERDDGSLIFIDFEYFGWDDPAKLGCDVLFHPAMKMPDDLQVYWVCQFGSLFGVEVLERMRMMWGLVGISWCLILLNAFRLDVRARRQHAVGNAGLFNESNHSKAIANSRHLLNFVRDNYQDPPSIQIK
jgi:hypothetical protein